MCFLHVIFATLLYIPNLHHSAIMALPHIMRKPETHAQHLGKLFQISMSAHQPRLSTMCACHTAEIPTGTDGACPTEVSRPTTETPALASVV